MSNGTNKRALSDDQREGNESSAKSYPRKRVSIACEVCRLRKTRCDAAKPACSFCADLGIDCTYKKPADASRPDQKSEELSYALKRLDRIESSLEQIAQAVSSQGQERNQRHPSFIDRSPFVTTPVAFRNEVLDQSPTSVSTNQGRSNSISVKRRYACKMPNLLTFKHPSSEHADWSWNCTEAFFIDQMDAIADMRQNVNLPHPEPDLTEIRVNHLQRSFSDHVLRWLPIFDNETATELLRYAKSTEYLHTTAALGVVFMIFANGAISSDSSLYARSAHELPGFAYYARAASILERLPGPSRDLSYLQCRVLVGIYLLFAMRPLEAWNNISQASKECILLIRANIMQGADPGYREAFRRIYWICYVLENELEACLEVPSTGIRLYETQIPLPNSHYEEDGMYFVLALSSLRKVMVEVLDTVGYKSASNFISYNPVVAVELRTQIDQWYRHLPAPLRFQLDNNFLFDTRKSYLRLSYFALRAVASWPFVMPVTQNNERRASTLPDDGSANGHETPTMNTLQLETDGHFDPAHREAAQICLEACRAYLAYAEEVLTSKSLASHLIVRQYYAFTMILILTFPGVDLQDPGSLEQRKQLESAIRNLRYWSVVPFMTAPLDNLMRIGKARGLRVT